MSSILLFLGVVTDEFLGRGRRPGYEVGGKVSEGIFYAKRRVKSRDKVGTDAVGFYVHPF